jgi:hypothetical protein
MADVKSLQSSLLMVSVILACRRSLYLTAAPYEPGRPERLQRKRAIKIEPMAKEKIRTRVTFAAKLTPIGKTAAQIAALNTRRKSS